MKLGRIIYSLWGGLFFAFMYILMFPAFAVIVNIGRFHKYAFYLNRLWSKSTCIIAGLNSSITYKQPLQAKQQYIYCANHSSYLDIPTVQLVAPQLVKFVGKAELGKVPLFGYMFNRLHIVVDRSTAKSRYQLLDRAAEELQKGFSIGIFPEGQISKKAPQLASFKDGAFRLAIQHQVPIVPITLLDCWRILPDKSLASHFPLRIICHAPISTSGLTLADVDMLREQCRQQVEQPLRDEFFPNR